VVGNNSGTVEKCVALNPSVSGYTIGRIIGNDVVVGDPVTNNYGRNDMTGTANGIATTTWTSDSSTKNGADVYVSGTNTPQYNTQAFWTDTINGVEWDTNVWNITGVVEAGSNKLPTLIGLGTQTPEVP